jgi:hypothetical protein
MEAGVLVAILVDVLEDRMESSPKLTGLVLEKKTEKTKNRLKYDCRGHPEIIPETINRIRVEGSQ